MNITDEEITRHREILPLPFEQITLYSSFVQLLGEAPEDYTPEERRKRFDRNLELMKEGGEEELYHFWAESGPDETCESCIHRNAYWCKWSELPCNYNPVLRMLGMACCGIGKEVDNQLKLFND